MTMMTDEYAEGRNPDPLVVWTSHQLCPTCRYYFEDCRCEPCLMCEAVHTGRCSYPSAEADDRLTNRMWS
jgi:hypothetical protein